MAGVCTGSGPCDVHPTGHGGNNFVTRGGGFDPYLRAIINALKRKGHPESEAVQLAIGTVQRWARGEGNVTAATRARAAASLAHWEALKAKAHSMTAAPVTTVDLAGPSTAERRQAEKRGAAMPGGRFPIRNHDDLRKAVRAVGRAKGDHATVRRFIARRAKAIGGSHLIPDHWKDDGSLDMTAAPPDVIDLAGRVYRYRHGWVPLAKTSEAHARLRRELTKSVTTALRATKGSREHKAALKRVDALHRAIGRLNTQL